MKTHFLTILFLFISIFSLAQIDYKGFPEWSFQQEGSTQYYLYTPSNMQVGQQYPIAIFLHGCCGPDNNATLRNCVDPPARMWHNFGDNTQEVPTYIIAPATSSGWSQHFTNLKAVMDDLIANGQGDPQRVYICGFSMGSGGTFDFVNTYPGYFAAVFTMASTYRGDYEETKNIPWWINVGAMDSYATGLANTTEILRERNGDDRGPLEWVTGVNPLFTSFDNVGHGVQWHACGTQDAVSWALSKVNDGNVYPVIFFNSPDNLQVVEANDDVILDITATDADGTIAQVEIYQEGKLIKTQTTVPFGDTVNIHSGNNIFEAIATDNNGKTTTARIIVRTDNLPIISTSELPDGKQGALYEKQIYARGNAPFSYKLSGSSLPEGLALTTEGQVKGIPAETGDFTVKVVVTDSDMDSTAQYFDFNIAGKNTDEVVVSNVRNNSGQTLSVSKMRHHELPNSFQSSREISISGESVFKGMTYIMTSANDADRNDNNVHTFDVDEDVTVYIGYEVKDNLYTSTTPSWLDTYTKESVDQIVCQYRYLDVYSQNFSAGTITLPGADAGSNNVELNYIIMVKKQGSTLNTTPSVSSDALVTGYVGYLYEEALSVVNGEGLMSWHVVSGSLPPGILMDTTGYISGYCYADGTYNFTVEVSDIDGDASQKALSIVIESGKPIEPVSFNLTDTIVVMNTGPHAIPLSTLSNHISTVQDLTVTASSSNTSVATASITEINDSTYSLTVSPLTDIIGTTTIGVMVVDNNNSDTLLNTTKKYFTFEVIEFINNAPECDPISNKTVGLNNEDLMHSFRVSGVSDGNGGVQNMLIAINSDKTGAIHSLKLDYDLDLGIADISFYPEKIGTETITLFMMDDGGTVLNGEDTKEIIFTITVVSEADYFSIETNNQTIELDGYKIYPNPANNWLFVSSPSEKAFSIEIHNLSGQLVFEGDNCTRIDTYSITPGVYILSIKENGRIKGKEKIIIGH